MAARFWVGGTGNWDAATTTHWAASSNGAGGQTVPASGDAVSFDANSGGGTVTVTATAPASGSLSSITFGAFTGTLNTNGQTISVTNTISVTGTGTRTLTLGASAISCSQWLANTSTNMTLNANTSTITVNGAGTTFNGGGLTYATVLLTGSGITTVTSVNTFTTLTRTGTAAKTDQVLFSSNQTISGTLTLNGNSVTNRLLVCTSLVGTARTISAGTFATANASNLDIQDITAAGTATWSIAACTGKSGDGGGNTGITFTTAAAQAWSGTSGGNWSANAWTSRVPLPQDAVTISKAFSASQTITADMPRLGLSITWAGSTGSPTWDFSSTTNTIYGSLTLISGMTISGTLTTTLISRTGGTNTLTSAGRTFTQPITIYSGGAVQLQDNFISNGLLTIGLGFIGGQIDANDKNVTIDSLSAGAFSVMLMGSGTWSLTSTAAATIWTGPGSFGSVTASTSTIVISNTSTNTRTFTGGSKTYATLTYTVAGSTGALVISDGGNTFATINFSDATNARTLTFANGTSNTITTRFNVNGTSGKKMTINSDLAGTAATLVKNTGIVYCDFLTVKDSTPTGSAPWYAGANSNSVSNTAGWNISAPIIASAAGGNWNTNGAWVAGAQPTAASDVVFISTSGNVTIPSGITALCRAIDFSGYTGTFTFAATTSNLNIGDASGGNCEFTSAMTLTLTGIGTINFLASTASTKYTLVTAAKLMPALTINMGSSTTTLQFFDAVGTGLTQITLTAGILDMNNQTISTTKISSNNANTRTLTMGSAQINCSGVTGSTFWDFTTVTNLTVTANTAIVTAVAISQAFTSDSIDYNGLSVSLTGSGSPSINAIGAFTIQNLTRIGTAVLTDGLSINGPFTVTAVLFIIANSIINRLIVSSDIIGTSRTITCNGTVSSSNSDYMDISSAGSTSPWNFSAGSSGDCGGNSNITFTTAAAQTATGTSGFTWSTHGWTSRVPLPQDNVTINNAFSASQTITADMPRLGKSVDFTSSTGSPTLSTPVTGNSVFGSLILVSGVTPSGTGVLNFNGRSTYSVTSAGATFTQSLDFNAPGGTYTLTDALNTNSTRTFFGTFALALILDGGTLTANNNVTLSGSTSGFFASGGTLNMGTGTWSISDTTNIKIWEVSGGTINGSSSTIVLTAASSNTRTFTGGGGTYGTLTYTVAGSTGQLSITDSNTFNTINFSDSSNARTLQLTAGITLTIVNSFNVRGTSGKLMTVNSSTGGSQATLSKASGVVSDDYLSLQDSAATGGANWFAGSHSTNTSNNTGWIFNAPPNFFPFF